MTQIFICDDEPFWIEQIEKEIINYQIKSDWEITITQKVTSPQELLSYLQIHKILNGIYFLDINLNADMTGLTLAAEIRQIDPHAIFVFVTTQEELVMETFRLKLEALDYILKDSSDLTKSIHSCLLHLEKRYYQTIQKKPFSLKVSGSIRSFSLHEIYFIDTIKNTHKINIHTRNEQYSVHTSLEAISKQLDKSFYKCNKNCIVNTMYITKLDFSTRTVLFENGESCECSIREWKKLSDYFNSGNY